LGYDDGRMMSNSMQNRNNMSSGGSNHGGLAIGYDDGRRGVYINPNERH